MVKIKYGTTEIKGILHGFSPGSSEFEVELDNGLKILLPATGQMTSERFMRMRATMTAVGLASLRNSTIDFTTGQINLEDGPKESVNPRKSIRSSFVV